MIESGHGEYASQQRGPAMPASVLEQIAAAYVSGQEWPGCRKLNGSRGNVIEVKVNPAKAWSLSDRLNYLAEKFPIGKEITASRIDCQTNEEYRDNPPEVGVIVEHIPFLRRGAVRQNGKDENLAGYVLQFDGGHRRTMVAPTNH
jgi:hypothetical protein